MAVFHSPTVAQLARFIEQNRDASPRALVELREGAKGAPLYCIHPAGSVSCYIPLAESIGGEFPIYGIDSCAIIDPDCRFASIDAMAKEYAELVRNKSSGPYRLLGWSMGGLIAHAIATHLEEANEDVAFLGLLDARLEADVNNADRFELFGKYLDRNPEDRRAFLALDIEERRLLAQAAENLPPEEWFLHVAAYGQTRGKWLRDLPLTLLKSLFNEWWNGIALTNAHAPKRIRSGMHVWWARDSLDAREIPPVDWSRFTSGNVSVNYVEGDHETIVHDAKVIQSIHGCLRASSGPLPNGVVAHFDCEF